MFNSKVEADDMEITRWNCPTQFLVQRTPSFLIQGRKTHKTIVDAIPRYITCLNHVT